MSSLALYTKHGDLPTKKVRVFSKLPHYKRLFTERSHMPRKANLMRARSPRHFEHAPFSSTRPLVPIECLFVSQLYIQHVLADLRQLGFWVLGINAAPPSPPRFQVKGRYRRRSISALPLQFSHGANSSAGTLPSPRTASFDDSEYPVANSLPSGLRFVALAGCAELKPTARVMEILVGSTLASRWPVPPAFSWALRCGLFFSLPARPVLAECQLSSK